MLRFTQAKNLWHKQIAVYSNSWNKEGEHARCHLQFSVWLLLWALGTRFHTHLVDMQISGSWWPWRFLQSGARDATRLHAYRLRVRVMVSRARRGTFPLSRNDVVYPERSDAIAWMSRSRGQGRAHASSLVVPVTCKGSGLRRSRGPETPSCRSATTWSITRWREVIGGGGIKHLNLFSLLLPPPSPVRIISNCG